MSSRIDFKVLLSAVSFILTITSHAQVPLTINYQGRLLDNTSLVNSNVSMVLRLYNHPTAGDLLCEDSNYVDVVDGLYSTYIGDDAPPGSLRDAMTNAMVFIEVEIDTVRLSPRERLMSVGYALMAGGVPNEAITTAMLADGAVTSNQLALGAVQSQNLGIGAVTSTHIATGAVQAAQLADGAVTSNKLAADSVSNTQLSKAYESGSITRSDLGMDQSSDFQTAKTNVSVSFNTPFATAPIVVVSLETDDDSLASAASCNVKSKTASEFTATVILSPPEPVHPVTNAWYGMDSSLCVVDGNPAIVSWSAAIPYLKYVRAQDSGGSEWSEAITFTNHGVEVLGNLMIVNSNPAVCYQNRDPDDLYFMRAQDTTGTSWDLPVAVDTNPSTGWHPDMAIVDGYPAISYYEYTSGDLMYCRALDENGASWGTPVRVSTNGNVGEYCSLAVVNGNPAISYINKDRAFLKYTRAIDTTGTNGWYTATDIYTNQSSANGFVDMHVVDGCPAICFYQKPDDTLMYVRSTNINGGINWPAPITLATNISYGSMAIINGQPAISYCNDTNECLMYIRANDTTGGTWKASIPITDSGYETLCSSLAEVDEAPAISYLSLQQTNLTYIRSSDFTSNSVINWIAIEP